MDPAETPKTYSECLVKLHIRGEGSIGGVLYAAKGQLANEQAHVGRNV